MNQRDQNQTRRGGHRQDFASSGRQPSQAEGSRQGRGMDEDRDWPQASQRPGSRMAGGGSAGQRFGETYNPEPQWLREDRDYGGAHARGEEEFEDRGRESSGRGSYAGSGRPWGEDQGGYRGSSGDFGGRQAAGYDMPGGRQYGSQYGSQYGAPQGGQYGLAHGASHGESQGRFGGHEYGSQGFARNLGRGRSGYGASRGGGVQEYGTPGYEASGYDTDLGYTGQSMGGRGAGSQSRAGAGTGYGSSSGYQFGTYQGDTGYQRSYRGMGPQNYKRPDERIRDDIYERLTDSHEIDARQVSVEVSQGSVTLSGTVPERQMRYAAEDLVEACMGVSNINNQLKVQDAASLGQSGSASGAGTSSAMTEPKRH